MLSPTTRQAAGAFAAALMHEVAELADRVTRSVQLPAPPAPAAAAAAAAPEPIITGEFVKANVDDEEVIAALRDVRVQASELKRRRDAIEACIKARIGDNAGIDSSLGRLTWVPSAPAEKVDWERMLIEIAAKHDVPKGELEARRKTHTSFAKAARPFNVPQAWRIAEAEQPPGPPPAKAPPAAAAGAPVTSASSPPPAAAPPHPETLPDLRARAEALPAGDFDRATLISIAEAQAKATAAKGGG